MKDGRLLKMHVRWTDEGDSERLGKARNEEMIDIYSPLTMKRKMHLPSRQTRSTCAIYDLKVEVYCASAFRSFSLATCRPICPQVA